MLQILPLGDLKLRSEKIGVSLKELAIEAGLDPSTPYRLAKAGGDMRVSTAEGLLRALLSHERRLFEHLVALHPEWVVVEGCPSSPALPRKGGEVAALEAA